MPFQPRPGDTITIDGQVLRFVAHPAVKRMVYGQAGRAAHVYRLDGDRGAFALKVFKPMHQVPALVLQAERLAPFASLAGLTVCGRTVIVPGRHAALLQQHPDLRYAAVMPWIQGPTWHDIINTRRPVDRVTSLRMATALATLLGDLEQRWIAHCDLSAPNLLLPMLDNDAGPQHGSLIQMVDVEQLYAPGFERPDPLVAGTPGYAHPAAANGIWDPSADRFAGMILISEMLGWQNDLVREQSAGQSYFDGDEMQAETPRFRLLRAALAEDWGDAVAQLFTRGWLSRTPAECPSLSEWLPLLQHLNGATSLAGQERSASWESVGGNDSHPKPDDRWPSDPFQPPGGTEAAAGLRSGAAADLGGLYEPHDSSLPVGPSAPGTGGLPSYIDATRESGYRTHQSPFVTVPTSRASFRPAGNGARSVALVMDLLLSCGMAFVIGLGLGYVLKISYVVPALLIWLAYFVLTWAIFSATPGQALFGLRVVDSQSDLRPTLWQSMVRSAAYALSIVSLGSGFLIALRGPGASSLADWLAQTRTVTIR